MILGHGHSHISTDLYVWELTWNCLPKKGKLLSCIKPCFSGHNIVDNRLVDSATLELGMWANGDTCPISQRQLWSLWRCQWCTGWQLAFKIYISAFCCLIGSLEVLSSATVGQCSLFTQNVVQMKYLFTQNVIQMKYLFTQNVVQMKYLFTQNIVQIKSLFTQYVVKINLCNYNYENNINNLHVPYNGR